MSDVFLVALVTSLYLNNYINGDDNAAVELKPPSLSLKVGDEEEILVVFHRPFTHNATFVFTYRDLDGKYLESKFDNESIVALLKPFNVTSGSAVPINRSVVALQPGHVFIGLNQSTENGSFAELDHVLCNVAIMHQKWLRILEVVVGWMYFAAWTVSFYPQMFLNWRRKSVVGFNFDFLVLNLTGFFVYSVYNLSLYAIPAIQDLYHKLYPVGEIPVRMNDIFFSVHAFVICIITGIQVTIYERGGQRISRVCIIILCLIAVYCIVNLILAGSGVYNWLVLMYNISYVKLFITLVKYIPQAVMNCRRRSTIGWSIGNICLDMTGGVLSILQMFIIAYNFDDYGSVFGSPTKVGLGLFSIMFDVFFMVQHWCLYPNADHLVESVGTPYDPTTSLSQVDDQDDVWRQTDGAIYRRSSGEARLFKNSEENKLAPESS